MSAKNTPGNVADLLIYEPETGVLRWKHRPGSPANWNARYAGAVAGTRGLHSVLVQVGGAKYRAHRIIWRMIKGADPSNEIDHIDGDPFNNALTNLREATHAQNMYNRRARGVLPKGVTQRGGRYEAGIRLRGVGRHLGTFDTPEEAHAAYAKAAQELFGKFACSNR